MPQRDYSDYRRLWKIKVGYTVYNIIISVTYQYIRMSLSAKMSHHFSPFDHRVPSYRSQDLSGGCFSGGGGHEALL